MCACFLLFGLWAPKNEVAHSKHKFKKKQKKMKASRNVLLHFATQKLLGIFLVSTLIMEILVCVT